MTRSYAESIVSSAEDPEKLLDQTVREMQEDLIKMKQTSAAVIASQKSMEAKYSQASKTAKDWYSRAQLALERGDEELAREALKRRRAYQENADSMKKQLDYQTDAVQKMIQNTRELESKIQEAKSKKDTLKARAQSAKASQQVSEIVGNLSTSTSMAAFERMEEKVLQMESQAEAVSGMIGNDDLEQKFAALEGGSVEDDLAELKSKKSLSETSTPKSLPEGRPIKDAIDFELEELRRKGKEWTGMLLFWRMKI